MQNNGVLFIVNEIINVIKGCLCKYPKNYNHYRVFIKVISFYNGWNCATV